MTRIIILPDEGEWVLVPKDMTEAVSVIDYWQRKGHKLHFRNQAGQPYGSESRKCDWCGVMLWPERSGAYTPDFTENRDDYDRSVYRCNHPRWSQPCE